MPTAPPPSRDVALETRVFWERFKGQIVAIIVVVAVAAVGFVAYRAYADKQSAGASALLARSKSAQDYQDVLARYPNTAAGAATSGFAAARVSVGAATNTSHTKDWRIIL